MWGGGETDDVEGREREKVSYDTGEDVEWGRVGEARTTFMVKVSIGVFTCWEAICLGCSRIINHIFKGWKFLYCDTACRK